MAVELNGIVEEIIYSNEENGYVIASVDSDGDYIIVVGYIPAIHEGDMMKFRGEFVVHKTYGEQFKIESCEQIVPSEEKDIEKYLGSGLITGIGPGLASRIVDKFGKEALNILQYSPDRLREVSGIGEAKIRTIIESFAEQRAVKEIMMYLQRYDISVAYATRIYKMYGDKTIQLLSENPYRMAEDISGIGFRMADKIAHEMGVDRESPYRISSGINYVINTFIHQGDTFAYEEDLIDRASDMLSVPREAVQMEVKELLIKGNLQFERFDERVGIYPAAYYHAEVNVCKKLVNVCASRFEVFNVDADKEIDKFEREEGIEFASKQKKAVKDAVENGVLVITGGPGTGKTTIINGIINIFDDNKMKVLLAAPTGRAAKRMSDATMREAKTIHRMLEYKYMEGESFLGFNKNSDDPLVADVIIIDEASMIDTILMHHLLEAITPGTRLVLVGDVDQLPSVGAGNVLKDIIESEIIPIVRLDEIFRQAKESMIVVNAHRINQGDFPLINEKGKDFFFIKAKSQEEILATVKNLCEKRLPSYYKYDPIKDIQVLTPMKNSKNGTINLNLTLQAALNGPHKDKAEKEIGNRIFRVGDKIMQIKNNYNIKWRHRYSYAKGEGVFNGDIGFVTEIDEKKKFMRVLFDDDKEVEYEFNQTDELIHAYAVTVHKSQGSEFPVVVMPITWGAPMLMNRNILYTAVTRAKELVVLVGNEQFLGKMVNNMSNQHRNTGLKMRLLKVAEFFKSDDERKAADSELAEVEDEQGQEVAEDHTLFDESFE